MVTFNSVKDDALKKATQKYENAQNNVVLMSKFVGVAWAILFVENFLITINFLFPWKWLLHHPNNYSLQGSFALMIFSGILGLFIRPWRTWTMSIFIGVLLVIIPLLAVRV